ncbi:MAG TPA: acyl-CoA desaturase [Polyangiales bacterium]
MQTQAHRQHEPKLSAEQLAELGAELDAIRDRVLCELGEQDARYIRELVARARLAEVSGRALLFAGVLPPAWLLGVGLLSLSKVLENMEIGHNVLHGQYDWLREPSLEGASYEWDWACPADSWRHSHNYVHHTFTNIVGQDRDLGYGLLRMAEAQPWHPAYLLQPLLAAAQALTFEWAVAVHDLELDAVLAGTKSLRQLLDDAQPVVRKVLAQGLKDYVYFPLLGGPAAPAIFAGNLSANLLRNVWAFSVIFCGHFPDGVQMFEGVDQRTESRAAWYLRQIRGSANCEGPGWFHVLSGHLSHQIEHHLYPDLPASRYPQIAAQVKAACEKHGVPYNTGSFPKQLAGALRRVLRGALPPALTRLRTQAAASG